MKYLKIVCFWLLSWTWGLPMTLLGAIISLGMLITGHKPKIFHYYIYFEVGNNWGGFECGCFFFANKNSSLSLKQHECGHGIQNIIFGWLMPFIVSIPSAVRYWYREWYMKYKYPKTQKTLPPYDSIWFEGWATKLGEKYYS